MISKKAARKKKKLPHWYQSRRSGCSKRQKRALRDIWPHWGRSEQAKTLTFGQKINLDAWFSRDRSSSSSTSAFDSDTTTITASSSPSSSSLRRRRWLDIGFGDATSLLELAEQHPLDEFLGSEIYRRGHANAALGIAEHQLNNVRLVGGCAKKFLKHFCPPCSLDRVCIFFPDPWKDAFKGDQSGPNVCNKSKTGDKDRNSRETRGSNQAMIGEKVRRQDDCSEGQVRKEPTENIHARKGEKENKTNTSRNVYCPVDRRMVSADGGVFHLLPAAMRPGSRLFLATDVHLYARHVLQILSSLGEKKEEEEEGAKDEKRVRKSGTTCRIHEDGRDVNKKGHKVSSWRLVELRRSRGPQATTLRGSVSNQVERSTEERDCKCTIAEGEEEGSNQVFKELQKGFNVQWGTEGDRQIALGHPVLGTVEGNKEGKGAARIVVKRQKEGEENGEGCGSNVEGRGTCFTSLTRPKWRPLTPFERKAWQEGRYVWDFVVDFCSV